MRGSGSGFGGMMSRMTGLVSGGVGSPNLDVLSDEGMLGSAYDHKVVMRIVPFFAVYKKQVAICMLSVLIYTAANVSIPLIVMLTINRFISIGDLAGLHVMGLVLVLVTLVHFVANYSQFVNLPRIGQNVLYDLRTKMFNHLQTLAPAFYDNMPLGRLMSRNISDIQQLQETFELMVQSLADMLSLIGIVLLMLIILPATGNGDLRLAAICLSVVPVLILVLLYWQNFARRSFIRIRRAIAMVNGEYNQNITGIRVVMGLNRQERNLGNFTNLNKEHLNANLQASRFSGGLMPIVEMLTGFSTGMVIVVGGILLLDNNLEWGVLVAFAMWIQRLFDPIRNLTMQYSQLQRAMASGMRVLEVLDLEPGVKDVGGAVEMPEIQGDIQYKGVGFAYVAGSNVLNDINLHIKPGQTVALVGATGVGKSTFVGLLNRFADVTEGKIIVDGYDIRDVSRFSYVSQMSTVPQDPYMFSGTILENIRYNCEDKTYNDVVDAAKVVGAHDFILRLENGYETVLAERGSNLSMGQRQLISFARAIISKPRILILDEATANIDTYTENLIQSALKKILSGRTSIVIAHRLSTIVNSDKIVVMQSGRIVETGRHEELLKSNGVYSRLHKVNYGLK